MLESVLYTVAQGSMNLIKACDFEKHCDEYAIFLFFQHFLIPEQLSRSIALASHPPPTLLLFI